MSNTEKVPNYDPLDSVPSAWIFKERFCNKFPELEEHAVIEYLNTKDRALELHVIGGLGMQTGYFFNENGSAVAQRNITENGFPYISIQDDLYTFEINFRPLGWAHVRFAQPLLPSAVGDVNCEELMTATYHQGNLHTISLYPTFGYADDITGPRLELDATLQTVKESGKEYFYHPHHAMSQGEYALHRAPGEISLITYEDQPMYVLSHHVNASGLTVAQTFIESNMTRTITAPFYFDSRHVQKAAIKPLNTDKKTGKVASPSWKDIRQHVPVHWSHVGIDTALK
ncbi:hypothetical protein KAZ66_02405 [Candidatus Woesebacteria bacterium]|nr:hypothetical protein [Candidatus Woesebacteria bacterium]